MSCGLTKNNGYCQGQEPTKENEISSEKTGRAGGGSRGGRALLGPGRRGCPPLPPAAAGGQVRAHHSRFAGDAPILEFRQDFVVLISVRWLLPILLAFKLCFISERVSSRWNLFSWAGPNPEEEPGGLWALWGSLLPSPLPSKASSLCIFPLLLLRLSSPSSNTPLGPGLSF